MKKKFYLLFLVASFLGQRAFAQVNYTFTAVSGTYTPITGGKTITLTADDAALGYTAFDEGYNNSVPIGFSFYYNGSTTATTTLKVNSDGFVALGTAFGANQDGYWYNNLTNGPSRDSAGYMRYTAYSGRRSIIAPLWADFDVQVAANVRYKLTGTAPNRVFTLEWANVLWDYQATGDVANVELILHETTNVIEFQYQSGSTAPSANAIASIGLTAAGTGVGKFLSLQDASTNPAVSRITENKAISTLPADGQIYRFTPAAPITNDAAVYTMFPLGTVAKNGDSYSVTSIISNLGTAAIPSLPVTLSTSGANTYSSTVTIPSLDSFKSIYVIFTGYKPSTTGVDNMTLSVPSDQDNSNNSKVVPINVTDNMVSTVYDVANMRGVGNQGATFEAATRFTIPTPKKISEVAVYFTKGTFADTTANPWIGNPFTLNIYDTTGTGGKPGTVLFTQTGLTSDSGRVVIPVSPSVAVADGYYVSVLQSDTNNIALGYELETPLRPNTFYYDLGTGFGAASSTYKFMVDVKYDTTTTVPVTLVKFTGTKGTKGTNLLKWTTTNELNNTGFEVTRSRDGKNFEKIAFVNSLSVNGNSSANLEYNFTDNKAVTGTNYYRLNQLDKNGKSTLSDVVVIKDKSSIEIATIYPNPVKSALNISINAPANFKATAVISDVTGKTLITKNFDIYDGQNIVNFDVNNLKTGSYIIKVSTNDGSIETKMFDKQ